MRKEITKLGYTLPTPTPINQSSWRIKENEDLTPCTLTAAIPHNHPSCSSYSDACTALRRHKPGSTECAPLAELHNSDTAICWHLSFIQYIGGEN